MKDKELLKTNLLISVILIIGFLITAIFSYRANYRSSLDNIEHVSALTTEGIYYQFTTIFTKPVNISLTMAHDSLLVEHLSNEQKQLENENYTWTIKNYLETYRKKYDFDSVFLASATTGRYYNFNGVDRVLVEGDPENEWYFDLLNSEKEYSLNVDNDEVDGADNAITVFVNCKIYDRYRNVLGIVGVGIRVNYLNAFLEAYESKYGVDACLLSEDGTIEISTSYTGYSKTDWFQAYEHEGIRRQVLDWKRDDASLALWTSKDTGSQEKSYIVSRYIPELSWHLIVMQDTGAVVRAMQIRLYITALIILAVIILVLVIITSVIRHFDKQITQLIEERQKVFQKATEQLYDNIYELNITKNRAANQQTEQYFNSLGAKNLPYDQCLRVIAQTQIREEFRDGYRSILSPENVLREYEKGNYHFRYDFMITEDGNHYFWMRIDAYAFFSQEDNCIHMFTYRKNIDVEKRRELLASIDEMTKFLTKTATKRAISSLLDTDADGLYAFFLFDIDNFKQANDLFGHAFGDYCILEFTGIIKNHFREGDILGRIGGDEFAAFIPIPNVEWVENKAKELAKALDTRCVNNDSVWSMAASIGISTSPQDGTDFDTLYQKADEALYRAKQRGKNGYTFWSRES